VLACGDTVVHTKPDSTYAGASVGLSSPLTPATTPEVPVARAAATARANFHGTITTVGSVGSSELFVDASSGMGRLAWETRVEGWAQTARIPTGPRPAQRRITRG
jgi:hypothetical protein